ncbi:hypothetical protein RAH32_14035 [Paracoccus sp. WLY502]|uniref:hypothetical protein n=1 Tax=Paracoccus yibinensis TaxID=3068891 RepID=UPI00279680BD|nr:hypothetical protein [Paracoccus sp. WLY502]MDQ1901565.1 hypothetical protein [Paracoccus sp. WLY502]
MALENRNFLWLVEPSRRRGGNQWRVQRVGWLKKPLESPAMDEYWICRRDNPHFRLTRDGRDFSTSVAPMVFASHDEAFAYMTRENTNPPLEGLSLEIVKAEA